MKTRFNIRSVCLLTFAIGILVAIFQQQGPWMVRIMKVFLLANALVALGGIGFGLYQFFGAQRES